MSRWENEDISELGLSSLPDRQETFLGVDANDVEESKAFAKIVSTSSENKEEQRFYIRFGRGEILDAYKNVRSTGVDYATDQAAKVYDKRKSLYKIGKSTNPFNRFRLIKKNANHPDNISFSYIFDVSKNDDISDKINEICISYYFFF